MTDDKSNSGGSTIERLVRIETEQERQRDDIRGLTECTRRLEQKQSAQEATLGDLRGATTRILDELSDFRKENAKKLGSVSEKVVAVETRLSGFQTQWKAACDGRHAAYDARLSKLEDTDEQAAEDKRMDKLVRAVESSQVDKRELSDTVQLRSVELQTSTERYKARAKMVATIAGGLLTGAGGTVLITFLMNGC